MSWLRRQAEIVSSLGVLLGAAAAMLVFFGGSIPPWYTPAQAQQAQQAAAQIQKSTVDTLNKLNDKIDRIQKRQDQGDCANLNATLSQATAALSKNSADPLARALYGATAAQMRSVPDCQPY